MYHAEDEYSSIFLIITNVFFNLISWKHNLMGTSGTFKPYIYSGAQYFPCISAAGMRFFQSDNISDVQVHNYSYYYKPASATIAQNIQKPQNAVSKAIFTKLSPKAIFDELWLFL